MASAVKSVPEGQHTITPHLVVKGAAEAIEFYKKAFSAEERYRMSCPQTGAIMHAELQIGDSRLFLCDEFPEACALGPASLGGTPVTVHLYVTDTDATFHQAVAAGATATKPPADMFWGDRYSQVVDPFGHRWSIASHIEDVSPEQMKERMAKAFA
ncbi:MAG: VOC family protein [Isosphaeraceae bacterium]|nr:VOC family protein [Isosphaeraceae bacterium]